MAPTARLLADRLDVLREDALQYWRAQTAREKVLIVAAAAVLALFAWRMWVWLPLQTARENAYAELESVEMYRAKLAALPADMTPSTRTQAPLRETITSTAAAAELGITRAETTPVGLEVELENTEFAELIVWIDALRRQGGVQVIEAQLSRQPSPGYVTAKLVFEE